MKYSEIINVNENFQTSINLEYDLNRIEKIKSYIPTEQSVDILGKLLKTFYYDKEKQGRASVLIGPYGRGKSHLLLVLSALTSLDVFELSECTKEQAHQIQLELCDKITMVDPEVGSLARTIVDDNIRTLPVIINSSTPDITQAFLIALKESLEKVSLVDLLPNTYFDAAIEVLDMWEESYPDAIKKVEVFLKKEKKQLEDLSIGLKQYHPESYSMFCRCYETIAAGTQFNPLTNMNVVKLYCDVSDALCQKTPFVGLNIIFDEFSKFIESNIDSSKMSNFKIIQDFAEIASRSSENQIHFTCVTHKDLLEYSSSDNFKSVEGRFNSIQYVSTSEQSYELIANAIPKNSTFDTIYSAYSDVFGEVINSAYLINLFDDMDPKAFENKVVKGCFPLSPLSAFALLHISEYVGQNERTLFTFLSRNEEYSLPEFLKKNRETIEFITVDSIFDYFQSLIKKEVFNTTIHSIWAKTDTALRQVRTIPQKRILKAIAVIGMLNDERFKPIPSHIKAALLMSDEDFDNAIHLLLNKHIVSQRDSLEIVLLTANGVDIQKTVASYVDNKIHKVNICEFLNTEFTYGYVVPRKYNDEYCMFRYFRKFFMSTDVFLNYKSEHALLEDYPGDGIILYLYSNDGRNLNKAINHLKKVIKSKRIIICITDKDMDLEPYIKKSLAIKQMINSELSDDPHYLEEMQLFEEDNRRQISGLLSVGYSSDSRHSKFFNLSGELEIYRDYDLNQCVSEICLQCYELTPKINNEMVNKNVLNAQNLRGRNLVVDWILSHSDYEEIPCMEGFGPEVSIFKSAYIKTGLYKNKTDLSREITAVLNVMNEFIMECEGKSLCVGDMYATLTEPPYGLRKGIIPLLFVYSLCSYKNEVVLYLKDKEVEISSSIISAMNDNPEDYYLFMEKGTAEKDRFIDDLYELFISYAKGVNSTANKMQNAVCCMQNWIRSLPEYTKKYMYTFKDGNSQLVDNSVKVVRSELLRFEISTRELLFVIWKNKLSQSGELSECLQEIKRVKNLLDSHISNFKQYLCTYLIAKFAPGYNGSLSRAAKLWYDNIPDAAKKHIFDSNTNSLLRIIDERHSFDDIEFVDTLALLYMSMSIEDWSDELAKSFMEQIESSISKVNKYTECDSDQKGECVISISYSGNQINKTFNESEISPLGKTALNNLRSVLEEYNDSIENDEKLSIITKLLSDIIR